MLVLFIPYYSILHGRHSRKEIFRQVSKTLRYIRAFSHSNLLPLPTSFVQEFVYFFFPFFLLTLSTTWQPHFDKFEKDFIHVPWNRTMFCVGNKCLEGTTNVSRALFTTSQTLTRPRRYPGRKIFLWEIYTHTRIKTDNKTERKSIGESAYLHSISQKGALLFQTPLD